MLEINGKMYARVSDILKPFNNFVGIPEDVLNRKAKIGTTVHHAINQEIQGQLPVLSIDEQGYFKSFYKWQSTLNPIFIESEMRYCCDKEMLTGGIDALVKLEGEDKAILVDWKTSSQENPITWTMQAHLYHYLLVESNKMVSDRMLFIKLNKKGDLPKVFQYRFDQKIMDNCLLAIEDFWNSVAINQGQ